MAEREYIHKPGEKKADITKDASSDATANSVRLEVDNGITTNELLKSLEMIKQRVLEIDLEK